MTKPKKPKYETARWFKSLGKCIGCTKPAVGELMSHRNDVIGPVCAYHGRKFTDEANRYVAETTRK